MRILPEAVAVWRRIRELHTCGGGNDDAAAEIRELMAELARLVGFNWPLIEPHRAGRKPWGWICADEQLTRWRQAKQIADALDAALAATRAEDAA